MAFLEVLKEYDALRQALSRDFDLAEAKTLARIARMAVRHVCERAGHELEPGELEKIVEALQLARS